MESQVERERVFIIMEHKLDEFFKAIQSEKPYLNGADEELAKRWNQLLFERFKQEHSNG